MIIKNCENPKVLYSCFYAIGIFSLESEGWFFENYDIHVIEMFKFFFPRKNPAAVLNIALQTFTNFFEKCGKNENFAKNQMEFFNILFTITQESKFVFIKENSVKSIGSCLICLKSRVIKENVYFIIEVLMSLTTICLKLENYENFKACVLEAIFSCLDVIYKFKFADTINLERLCAIIKV